MVAVGYMDPGNWATDLAGGSRYNYALIWVLLMSNLMAILLQSLAARLGIVSRRDLAQINHEEYHPAINIPLYILAEIAITACDLAEVLGSAIALQLLFGLPLLLAPIHIAFLEMVIDPVCTLVFEAETEQARIARARRRGVLGRLEREDLGLAEQLLGMAARIVFSGVEVCITHLQRRAQGPHRFVIYCRVWSSLSPDEPGAKTDLG